MSNGNSYWQKVVYLFVGALVPVLAGAVPWLLDRYVAKDSLVYTVEGPIRTKDATAFSVTVVNDGSSTQRNVEVWLPQLPEADLRYLSLSIKEPTQKTSSPSTVVIDSDLPGALEAHDGKRVMKFDSLRPSESVTISGFVLGASVLLSHVELKSLRVVSSETVASHSAATSKPNIAYRAGFWLLVVLLVGGSLYGIYYERFMPTRRKINGLLAELKKLKSDQSDADFMKAQLAELMARPRTFVQADEPKDARDGDIWIDSK